MEQAAELSPVRVGEPQMHCSATLNDVPAILLSSDPWWLLAACNYLKKLGIYSIHSLSLLFLILLEGNLPARVGANMRVQQALLHRRKMRRRPKLQERLLERPAQHLP